MQISCKEEMEGKVVSTSTQKILCIQIFSKKKIMDKIVNCIYL